MKQNNDFYIKTERLELFLEQKAAEETKHHLRIYHEKMQQEERKKNHADV